MLVTVTEFERILAHYVRRMQVKRLRAWVGERRVIRLGAYMAYVNPFAPAPVPRRG